ncbi:MAG: PSD1 and planctomycete cytochrome C domain-containing protein [Planctomycetota bacterium]
MMYCLRLLVLACCIWSVGTGTRLCAEEPAKPVDYVTEIKPLLAQRCGSCHGTETQKSGFRVDSASSLIQGGDSGEAIVPGKPGESLLLQAILGTEGATRMPPKDPRLTDAEVDLIKRWIEQGAKAPEGGDAPLATAEIKNRNHWSFQPVQRHSLPAVKQSNWGRNEIDAFVLARLEADGLTPSSETDRVTLIRRLSLDLLGLPPTPAQVSAFVADESPDAYERLVDQLLASPHYGERMARQWLDLARYADSNGFTRDQPRVIWKYRNWVIDAFNQNMPFSQFAVEQIAGDMLPEATVDQQIATGFHRNTLFNEEGGTDDEQFRVEAVVDRVSTTGAVFLGLTVGCAQCHDHKYDPISQREFYQLFAFLNNSDEPKLDVPTPEQVASGAVELRKELRKKIKELEADFKKQRPQFDMELAAWEKTVTEEQKTKLPILVTNALNLSAEMRTPELTKPLIEYFKAHEISRQKFPMLQEIAELRAKEPSFVTTLVMQERKKPRETHIHIRGDFLRHGIKVVPAVPAVLPPLPAEVQEPTRLDLARWLVSEQNPLTPRVTVNRLWQKFFGRGLVETENDFGLQGSPPTHPELLDWLASEFVATGWNLKAIQRTIVLSATYRQSSKFRTELAEMDPLNKLYGRQSRLRLDAELIRDVALAASGLLAPAVGGPSVYPPQPAGVFDFTQDKKPWVAATGNDRYRRGMYTYLWRSSPYPAMSVFDFPDANVACTRRNRSNTPLQSLTLANDQTFVEFAQGLARRILLEVPGDDTARVTAGFRWCFGRDPQPAELQRLLKMLEEQRATFTTEDAQKIAPSNLPSSIAPTEAAAWTAVARVLINLDEFITRE